MSDLDAVNKNMVKEHEKAVCPNSMPICPACVAGPIPPGFKARCENSACRKVDLSNFNTCKTSADCRVRTLDCCEDCQADTNRGALVAIAKKDAMAVKKRLCGSSPPACLRCRVNYPSGVKAVCNNGRCQLK